MSGVLSGCICKVSRCPEPCRDCSFGGLLNGWPVIWAAMGEISAMRRSIVATASTVLQHVRGDVRSARSKHLSNVIILYRSNPVSITIVRSQ
jgi:hypothetical protein